MRDGRSLLREHRSNTPPGKALQLIQPTILPLSPPCTEGCSLTLPNETAMPESSFALTHHPSLPWYRLPYFHQVSNKSTRPFSFGAIAHHPPPSFRPPCDITERGKNPIRPKSAPECKPLPANPTSHSLPNASRPITPLSSARAPTECALSPPPPLSRRWLERNSAPSPLRSGACGRPGGTLLAGMRLRGQATKATGGGKAALLYLTYGVTGARGTGNRRSQPASGGSRPTNTQATRTPTPCRIDKGVPPPPRTRRGNRGRKEGAGYAPARPHPAFLCPPPVSCTPPRSVRALE